MIAIAPATGTAMLEGLLTVLGNSATVALYASTRPAAGDAGGVPLATIPLDASPGLVSGRTLTLSQSGDGQLVAAGSPVWARVSGAGGAWVFDCGARLSSDPDNGEELVVSAPAIYPGAFVRIAGGSLSI